MTERKLDLERRIEALYSERDGLSTTLDESADRIVMLEKESREQDSMVQFPIQIKSFSQLLSSSLNSRTNPYPPFTSLKMLPHSDPEQQEGDK